jgi:hypothetical protein
MHQPSKVYEVIDSKGKFKPELHHLDGHVDVPDQAVTLQTGIGKSGHSQRLWKNWYITNELIYWSILYK